MSKAWTWVMRICLPLVRVWNLAVEVIAVEAPSAIYKSEGLGKGTERARSVQDLNTFDSIMLMCIICISSLQVQCSQRCIPFASVATGN